MHSLLTEIIFLKPASHLKQSEEQGINILASARSKSSSKYIRKTINISTKARGYNPSENELWAFILKSSLSISTQPFITDIPDYFSSGQKTLILRISGYST